MKSVADMTAAQQATPLDSPQNSPQVTHNNSHSDWDNYLDYAKYDSLINRLKQEGRSDLNIYVEAFHQIMAGNDRKLIGFFMKNPKLFDLFMKTVKLHGPKNEYEKYFV